MYRAHERRFRNRNDGARGNGKVIEKQSGPRTYLASSAGDVQLTIMNQRLHRDGYVDIKLPSLLFIVTRRAKARLLDDQTYGQPYERL